MQENNLLANEKNLKEMWNVLCIFCLTTEDTVILGPTEKECVLNILQIKPEDSATLPSQICRKCYDEIHIVQETISRFKSICCQLQSIFKKMEHSKANENSLNSIIDEDIDKTMPSNFFKTVNVFGTNIPITYQSFEDFYVQHYGELVKKEEVQDKIETNMQSMHESKGALLEDTIYTNKDIASRKILTKKLSIRIKKLNMTEILKHKHNSKLNEIILKKRNSTSTALLSTPPTCKRKSLDEFSHEKVNTKVNSSTFESTNECHYKRGKQDNKLNDLNFSSSHLDRSIMETDSFLVFGNVQFNWEEEMKKMHNISASLAKAGISSRTRSSSMNNSTSSNLYNNNIDTTYQKLGINPSFSSSSVEAKIIESLKNDAKQKVIEAEVFSHQGDMVDCTLHDKKDLMSKLALQHSSVYTFQQSEDECTHSWKSNFKLSLFPLKQPTVSLENLTDSLLIKRGYRRKGCTWIVPTYENKKHVIDNINDTAFINTGSKNDSNVLHIDNNVIDFQESRNMLTCTNNFQEHTSKSNSKENFSKRRSKNVTKVIGSEMYTVSKMRTHKRIDNLNKSKTNNGKESKNSESRVNKLKTQLESRKFCKEKKYSLHINKSGSDKIDPIPWKELLQRKYKIFQCAKCERNFEEKSALKEHMNAHKEKINAKISDVNNVASLRKPEEISDCNHICSIQVFENNEGKQLEELSLIVPRTNTSNYLNSYENSFPINKKYTQQTKAVNCRKRKRNKDIRLSFEMSREIKIPKSITNPGKCMKNHNTDHENDKSSKKLFAKCQANDDENPSNVSDDDKLKTICHKPKKQRRKRLFTCEKCGEKFQDKLTLRKHVNFHTRKLNFNTSDMGNDGNGNLKNMSTLQGNKSNHHNFLSLKRCMEDESISFPAKDLSSGVLTGSSHQTSSKKKCKSSHIIPDNSDQDKDCNLLKRRDRHKFKNKSIKGEEQKLCNFDSAQSSKVCSNTAVMNNVFNCNDSPASHVLNIEVSDPTNDHKAESHSDITLASWVNLVHCKFCGKYFKNKEYVSKHQNLMHSKLLQ